MPYKCDMTKREFTRRLLNGKKDVLQIFLDLLKAQKIKFCVIGGLAVNAYAEPVVSLDLDIVVAAGSIQKLKDALPGEFKAKEFPNSLNLSFRNRI